MQFLNFPRPWPQMALPLTPPLSRPGKKAPQFSLVSKECPTLRNQNVVWCSTHHGVYILLIKTCLSSGQSKHAYLQNKTFLTQETIQRVTEGALNLKVVCMLTRSYPWQFIQQAKIGPH